MRRLGRTGVSWSNSAPIERFELGIVDAVDVDQRAVALAAPRRPRRSGHLIPGAKLAALHLGGGHVDVVGARVEPSQPQEPEALGHDLEHPGDLLGLIRLQPLAASLRLRLRSPGPGLVRLGLDRGRLADLGLARPARLDLPDELLTAQQPEPRHAELRRSRVQVGQVQVLELLRHGAPQNSPS